MRGKHILITGGAGFIGSHLADELLARGYRVRALDNLSPQVHGPERQRPDYLGPDVELIVGDIRDSETVKRALNGVDAVFHFAAMVGVGQSMYQISDYVDVNCTGTAVLLQALVENPVGRLVVASSMSVYGEGLYKDVDGNVCASANRSIDRLKAGQWNPTDKLGRELIPLPTPETKQPFLASIYALSKFDQEQMCLITGRAYSIPTVALRFFNVYGTRQALSNPYTGVLAIFASRLLNGNSPIIFEDGLQQRDFVNVKDVARGCILALESDAAPGNVINIGSGRAYTVADIAQEMARVMSRSYIEPEITGKYRVGDIRHCYSDITLAKTILGYEPRVTFEEGLLELAQWLDGRISQDRVDQAASELEKRRLTV